MISINPTNTKQFMSHLLLENTFDSLCICDVKITTKHLFTIDGKIAGEDGYAKWNEIRPFCLHIIQGTQPPESFSLVFMLPAENMQSLFEREQITGHAVRSLFLNVRYELGKVTCTGAVSYDSFQLDKTPQRVWDQALLRFFETNGIENRVE